MKDKSWLHNIRNKWLLQEKKAEDQEWETHLLHYESKGKHIYAFIIIGIISIKLGGHIPTFINHNRYFYIMVEAH